MSILMTAGRFWDLLCRGLAHGGFELKYSREFLLNPEYLAMSITERI